MSFHDWKGNNLLSCDACNVVFWAFGHIILPVEQIPCFCLRFWVIFVRFEAQTKKGAQEQLQYSYSGDFFCWDSYVATWNSLVLRILEIYKGATVIS